MTDRPIIFSALMVRALLDGRKSQTRRVLKPQPFPVGGPFYRPFEKTDPCLWYSVSAAGTVANIQKVPYAPGDRLYVREAACWVSAWGWRYRVDNDDLADKRAYGEVGRWMPSIHMPRSASRLTLTVTEVRVQRLQEISEADAQAEGCVWSDRWEGFTPCPDPGDARYFNSRSATRSFEQLWSGIHGHDAWDANPWVVAVSFTTRKGNIDAPSSESASAARGEEG